MFGGAGFGGFGQSQPQQSPFGAAPSSPFGAAPAAPAFGGQQASPFGAPATGVFGASQPAFGAASSPAFGATGSAAFGGTSAFGAAARPTTTGFGGFGSTAFGASQPAFGAASTPAFGQQPAQQSAFGIASAPSFGGFGGASTPAFGAAPAASPFGGGSAFGQSAPAFGASSAPAFGAAAPSAFGAPAAGSPFGGTSNVFGGATQSPTSGFGAQPAAGGLFGQPATGQGMFGAPAAGATGTRVAPYSKTVEKDGSSTATGQAQGNFISITAMPQYQGKSVEELRFEDYTAGVKSAAAGPAGPAANPFGAASPAAAPSPFGLPSTSTGAFGQAAPAASPFGGATTGGLFGSQPNNAFGAQSQSAFGASPSAFGASQPAFGQQASTPAFGGGFGASSAPAFGASAAPAFGASTGSSLFGGTTAPAFGAASSGSAFSFNSSPSLFGGTSAPAAGASPFGAAPSPFGASSAGNAGSSLFGPSSGSPFGASSAPAFGASSSPFGGTTFGAAKPASSAFGGTSLFGPTTGSAFGTTTTGGMFGSTGGGFGLGGFGAPASQPAGSMFGGSQPSLFGGSTAPSMFGSGSSFMPQSNALTLGQPFGQQGAAQPQGQPPSVSQAPYGSFQALPAVPEPKVGISSRNATRTIASGGTSSARASPLLSLRNTATSTTPKLGVQVRQSSLSPLGVLGAGPAGSAPMSPAPSGAGGSGMPTPGSGMALLQPRANPHRLFIREPPPSTEAASNAASPSPALTPARGTRAWTPMGDATPHNPFSGFNGPDQDGMGDDVHAAASPRPARTGGQQNGGLSPANGAGAAYLPQLGRLAADGYTYEPSATQLEAMYTADPSSLRRVHNFTVSRPGVGSIRWLQPVDIKGLKLDGIVTIQQGEVFCYADGEKPPVGQGLNTDAEITLCGVFKVDPQTQTPVKDGPRLAKWEKALRAMCARMGAKFVSYKPDGGLWKFEVEHFSRYGLLPEDEDDEEGEADAVHAAAAAQQQRKPGGLRFGLGSAAAADGGRHAAMEDYDNEEEEILDLEEDMGMDEEEGPGQEISLLQHGSEGAVYGTAVDGPEAGTEDTGPAAPLQHTLPTRLALDPSNMRAMKDSFFTGSSGTLGLAAPPHATSTLAGAMDVDGFSPAPTAYGQQALMPSHHAWRRSPAPLSTTPGPAMTRLAGAGAGAGLEHDVDEPGSAQPLALAIGSPIASTLSDSRPPFLARGQAAEASPSASFVDAGLSMGRSFRAGWGPGGVLVVPGPHATSVGSSPQPIYLTRVRVEGSGGAYDEGDDEDEAMASGGLLDNTPTTAAPARLAALRTRLRACLAVHVQHSGPTGAATEAEAAPGSGEGGTWRVPQWQLRCQSTELGALVEQLVAAAERGLQAAGAGEEESARVAHEADTWRLLQVLYEHITPVITDAAGQQEGADQEMGDEGAAASRSAAALSRAASSAEPANQSAPLLVSFERQAAVSRWLQKQAVPRVERALASASSPPEAVLQLLSGRQLVGAAAVAAAAGDTRLATLIASAGQHAQAQAELARQLEVWQGSSMTQHVAADRLLVYKLLAGQVLDTHARLQLDWRRFLGLLVWYHSFAGGSGAVRHQAGHVANAIHTYASMLAEHGGGAGSSSTSEVPPPLPHYAEDELGGSLGSSAMGAVDLQFALLQLWAAQQAEQGAVGEAGAAAPQPPFAALLAASGHSPNPCEGWVPWALMTVLQALGVLQAPPSSDQDPASAELLLSAHLSLITQLLLAGGLSELAVYVALHLPDSAPGWNATGAHSTLRDAMVAELLARTAPEWAGDARKTAFLRDTLQLPQPLLAGAGAAWARYCHNVDSACSALLEARAWSPAHDLLVRRVAPAMVMTNRLRDLAALVAALAPHAPSLPSWPLGGGLYDQFLAAFGPAAASARPGREQLQELAGSIAAAAAALKAASLGAVEEGDEQVVVAAGAPTSLTPAALQQRVVLARMAARVHAELMRLLAEANAKGPAAQAEVAPELLRSALALCGAEPSLRPAAVGTTAWHLGGALLTV